MLSFGAHQMVLSRRLDPPSTGFGDCGCAFHGLDWRASQDGDAAAIRVAGMLVVGLFPQIADELKLWGCSHQVHMYQARRLVSGDDNGSSGMLSADLAVRKAYLLVSCLFIRSVRCGIIHGRTP